jgi:FkbM family methyltransferase
MKNILISGAVFEEDLAYVKSRGSNETLRVKSIPYMGSIADIARLCAEAGDADLLIFRLIGQNPLAFIEHCRQTGTLTAFEKLACPKVVWSHDSHHMYPHEAQAEPYFTRFYIAHGNYIDKFSARAVWLPCSYISSSISTLLNLSKIELNKERELISAYRIYLGNKRNYILYQIYKIIKNRNIRYAFCLLQGQNCINTEYGNLLYGLKTSSISLNVPFLDDFNIRNFESIAMNCSLLAVETTEHKKVDLDYSHTFFFKSDLSDFRDALEAALDDMSTAKDTWRCIPGKHMLIDRYISIINNELETDFFIDIKELNDNQQIHVNPNAKWDDGKDNVYSDEFLLAHSIISLLSAERVQDALRQFTQAKNNNFNMAKVTHEIISLVSNINNAEIHRGLVTIFTINGFTREADTIFKVASAGVTAGSMFNAIKVYINNAQQLSLVENYRFHTKVFLASIKGLGILNYENFITSGDDFFLRKMLSGKDRPVIIDIGANIGKYALEARKISNDARIYAFEPNPAAFSVLKIQARKNNIFALPIGMSDNDKEAMLFDTHDISESADAYKYEVKKIYAKFTTLDIFLKTQNFESIDLVRITTGGHALAVLNGAVESIHKKMIKAFQIEFNEKNSIGGISFYRLKQALPGYSWYRLLSNGMVPIDGEPSVLQEIYAFQNLAAMLKGSD